MIFSHALTSRPIVGEMTAKGSAIISSPIEVFEKIEAAEGLAIISSPIEVFEKIGAAEGSPAAAPAFQSKGLSEAKNSFSDGTITFCFISLVIVPKVKQLVCMDCKSWWFSACCNS